MVFNCNRQSSSRQLVFLVILTIWSNYHVSTETPTTRPSVPDQSMVELIGDRYDRMAKSLSMADLEKDVSSNVLTFFVPTDEAFRDVPWSIAQEMLVNTTFLRLVIESHIIPGTFPSNVLPGNSIYSVGGEPLNFTKKTVKDCDLVLVNSIPILEPDQVTTNGIVHGITRLILAQKLIDECKCGQPKANDIEPKTSTSSSSTTNNPLNPSSVPERIVAGHSDQPAYVTIPPENYYVPSTDKFLRRSQAANPELFVTPESPSNSSSTTPFPYYNVWDDLVANHNLTTNSNNQGDNNNKSREIEEERPRFFRTRLPGRVSTESSLNPSSPPVVTVVPGTNNNNGRDHQGSPTNYDNYNNNSNPGSPTPPPRFGLRRRVVIRPQPTPRPYSPNDSVDVSPYDASRPIPRPNDNVNNNNNNNNNNVNNNNNDQLVPSVYYVEDPEGVEHVTPSRDNSPTYSPPLVYRPVSSTTPSPFIRVTSPPLDNRRRQPQDARFLTDSPINDQPNSQNGYINNNNNYPTTRPPYFRRPVPTRSPDQTISRNVSNCHPQDVNCLVSSNPINNVIPPSDNFRANSPDRYDPRFKPELGPIREFEPSTSPRTPVANNRFRRPSTEYFLNDLTTPSTTFFDSTRRPTSRNPQDLWRSTPSPISPAYEDDSANYVRRFGSQRPGTGRASNPRDRTIVRSTTTTTTESPNYRNVPVYPIDSRGSQDESRYRPSRPNYNEPVFPREPKNDEPTEDSNTVADILEDPGLFLEKRPISFSMFKDLMRRAGLHNLASSKKPITVFLPTDDAFEELENTGFDKVYRNPIDLQAFLLRHLVNYPIKPGEMRDGLVIRSISNSPILIKAFDDGMVYANGSPILAATEATNGYVYVLGKVIRDNDNNKETKDIVSEIVSNENASIFASLLRRSNLIPQLQEPGGPWTILVPDNEAFAEIQPETRNRILSDQILIKSLVGNHIINGSFSSEKLSRARNILPLVGQKPLKIRAFPGALIINNHASVKQPDLQAKNGVIHTLSRVLLPDELKANQSGRVRGRAYEGLTDLSNQFHPRRGLYSDTEENEDNQELGPKMKARKFVSWLEKSGVLDQLKQNNTFYTVIIPTDEAVGKLPSQILNQLDSEPKNLASLLKYHVIPGEIDLKSLKDGQVLKALDEKPIQYTKLNSSNQSLVSGAPVVDEYKQGEIKYLAVDRVLYPPHGTVFDIISGSPILTNISQIIKTANLVSEFSNSAGPYTVFAPTDEAFATLGQEELLKVTRDIKSSRDFLVKHTLRSVLFTSAIPMNDRRGLNVENIDKKLINLQRKPNYVTANGVPLAYADITAINGVIHVLSKPL